MNWNYFNPLYDIRKGTDQLGITSEAPPVQNLTDPNNPAYKALTDAAGQFNQNYQQAGEMMGGTFAGVDAANKQQQQTIDQLRAAASGAPTAATNLMRQQTDQNSRNAINAAAAFEGTNPGEALRAGLSSAQQTQAASTASGAALAAQEQEQARHTLAAATGANQGAAGSQYGTAGNILGTAAANYNSANQAPFNAQLGQNQTNVQQNAANSAAMGGLISAGGKIAATASDPQLKKDVHSGGELSDEFLNSLAPKEFHYKDEANPLYAPGKRLGVMADDLPRHDVTTGPDGKKWISASAISDILGGLGRLHQRVSAVEAARAYA